MFRKSYCIVVVVIALSQNVDLALAQKGNPAGNSAKWDFIVTDDKGKLFEKGSFVARGLSIHHNGKLIGTYTPVSETHINMDITQGKLVGKLDLRRENVNTLNWTGELARANGLKFRVNIVFEKLAR